jgi:uncharacterized protein (TIGR00255 family)
MRTLLDSADLLSMTGFAVIERPVAGRLFRIQLKSVNHRHFELKWKAPRSWSPLEIEARGLLQERIKRGSVECWIESVGGNGEASSPKAAKADHRERAAWLWGRLNQALSAAKDVPNSSRLPLLSKILVLSSLPHYWLDSEEDQPVSMQDARLALGEATSLLLSERAREGAKLGESIRGSLESIARALEVIEAQLPALLKTQQAALKERLGKLARELDVQEPLETRLLQEFLVLAERRDVAEERDRIRIHLDAFRELLKRPGDQGNGRRMDFMIQELSREWSTLGTKILEPRVLQTVIDAKIELDRIKEQAANVA